MRTELLALLVAVLVFVVYLLVERLLLERRLDSVPLRIAVTGTRGKSSVVRLLASILRADGRAVLAKTTGSEPRYLLPDGTEIEVPRRGIASIIEQKKLAKKAAELGADCLVAEIMSIHPENHVVESHRLLRPQIVVLTNVRRDHTDAMGETEEEIASVLALGVTPGCEVFMLENEKRAAIRSAAEKVGARIIEVLPDRDSDLSASHSVIGGSAGLAGVDGRDRREGLGTREKRGTLAEFGANLELAAAVTRHLGISEETISAGIRGAAADAGAVRAWKLRHPDTGKHCILVSGFAVNDPQSTLEVVGRVRRSLLGRPERFVGLLALRPDRGDRTRDWIAALRGGEVDCFDPLYVTGIHARAMQRKLPALRVLAEGPAGEMTAAIMAEAEDGAVIFGCGNYVGAGERLAGHWERTGSPYGL
jgi:UDP-N-acetylmuramyl tripeptide synthase